MITNHEVLIEFRGRVASLWQHARLLAAAGALLSLAGCASETLFQSSFNSNAVGSPPSPTQAVGTAQVSGDPGSVVIVGPVPNSSENWVKITRASVANNQAGISTFLGNFSKTLLRRHVRLPRCNLHSDGQRTRLGRVRHQPVRLAAFHKFSASRLSAERHGALRRRSGRDVRNVPTRPVLHLVGGDGYHVDDCCRARHSFRHRHLGRHVRLQH